MRAVYITSSGGPEVLQCGDLTDPIPGPGEVRVRVRACALNHLDLWVRKGARAGASFPLILGSDISGEVESAGPGADAKLVGQKAVLFPARSCGACRACREGTEPLCPKYEILGRSVPGGYAQFICAPVRNVFGLPDGLGWEEAAAIPLTFVTAYEMLFSRAKLGPGETVLVTAAASGVGTAAVQLAKAFGARVIAATRSPDKVARLRELMADEAIACAPEELPRRALEINGGAGVDVVFDSVGGPNLAQLLDALTNCGRLVTCGATAGPQTTLAIPKLFARRTLLGSFMGSTWQLREILKLVGQKKVRPVVDRIFPLEQAAEAHRRLESGGHLGKVVLRIG